MFSGKIVIIVQQLIVKIQILVVDTSVFFSAELFHQEFTWFMTNLPKVLGLL